MRPAFEIINDAVHIANDLRLKNKKFDNKKQLISHIIDEEMALQSMSEEWAIRSEAEDIWLVYLNQNDFWSDYYGWNK